MAVLTSTNYWETIFTELQEAIEENSRIKYLYIAKKYDQAIRAVEDRIRFFYGKNATDNKIPLRQAYKKLPPEQLEMFRDLIATYLRDWRKELGYSSDEQPVDHAEKVSKKDTDAQTLERLLDEDTLNDADKWVTLLEEYETKPEVTQYEALSIPILNEVEKASHSLGTTLLVLTAITGWVVYSDIAKHLKFATMSQEALKAELLKSWAADNMNLYDRLSTNKAKLSAAVKTSLLRGFRNELSVDEVVTEVAKTMGIGEIAAKRLVVTENGFFNTHATYLALKQAGFTHYRYNCRLLPTSCEDCIALHNTVFPLDAYEVGVTSPPLHPNCLCYISGEVI